MITRALPGLLSYQLQDQELVKVQLREELTTLGRSGSCVVAIAHPTVSRLHARIELQHDRYVIFDAGSANGTFVNGSKIEHAHQLSTGDEIWLGTSEVTLHFSDPEETVVAKPQISPPSIAIDEQARTV